MPSIEQNFCHFRNRCTLVHNLLKSFCFLSSCRIKVKEGEKAEWKYTINFCTAVEGSDDVGVLQEGNWENNTDSSHIIGKITHTDIKRGSKYAM